jgi:hypothetical protein
LPSHIDLGQLAWLGQELSAEGVPALMAIAGDDGAFSFMLVEDAHASGAVPRRIQGGRS